MKNHIKKLPKELRDLVYLARDVGIDKKMPVYLVGGFVRDLILGVPNFDLDIVVEGNGFEFASECALRIQAKMVFHPRFKTATLVTHGKQKLDIATARSEIYPHPGSLPVVSPGTIKEDLARRDFTINALAVDLSAGNFGQLVDYANGSGDLRKKYIRVLHDLSFIDDPTRIIRAVRFEQRLNFRIEKHTFMLLKESRHLGMLRRVSPQRLRDEIILILEEPAVFKAMRRINKLVGFDFIHPELELDRDVVCFLTAVKKEVEWYSDNFPQMRPLDIWVMYFAGFLSVLNKRQVKQVCKNFSFYRGAAKRIISFLDFSNAKVSRLRKKSIMSSQIYKILEPLSFEVILLIKAKYKNKLLDFQIESFLKYYSGAKTYITGRDLNKLGLSPGPDYKKILNRVLYLQLDGRINSSQDALEWVRHRYL